MFAITSLKKHVNLPTINSEGKITESNVLLHICDIAGDKFDAFSLQTNIRISSYLGPVPFKLENNKVTSSEVTAEKLKRRISLLVFC